jgi:hypothetical protein
MSVCSYQKNRENAEEAAGKVLFVAARVLKKWIGCGAVKSTDNLYIAG